MSSFKAKTVFSLFAINFLGQVIGFILQIIVAGYFGASAHMDAYVAGMIIPQYAITVMTAAIGASFIPFYFQKKTDSLKSQFVYQVFYSLLFLGLLLSVAGSFFSGFLVNLFFPNLDTSTKSEAAGICSLYFFTIVSSFLIFFLSGLFQVKRQFNYQSIIPFVGQLFNLVFIVGFGHLGIRVLVYGVLISQLIQVMLLLKVLRPYVFINPFNLNWVATGFGNYVRPVFFMLAATIFVKCSPFLDRFLANRVSPVQGAIAHMDYASRMLGIITTIFINVLPVLIFPELSQAIADQRMSDFNKVLKSSFNHILVLTVPVVVIGYACSLSIITIILQHGKFTAADSLDVSLLFQVYLFSLLPAALGSITGKALYAFSLFKITSVIGAVESIIYIFYTYLLSVRFGLIGIPLGFIIYYSLSFCWALYLIYIKSGNQSLLEFIDLRELLKLFVAGIITAIVLRFLVPVQSNALLQSALYFIVGLLVYVLSLWCLHAQSLRDFLFKIQKLKILGRLRS
jgi:putative peptidoglycan lipid II flippase